MVSKTATRGSTPRSPVRAWKALGGAAALVAACLAALGIAGAAARAPAPRVRVPAHPDVRGAVAISFRPSGRLPRGGYYYAVAVLARYPGYSRAAPPPCAVSSDMRRTAYAYPRGGQYVRLTLRAASSARRRWCSGGTYDGAVYAVPHKPPCSAEYPCGRSTALSPCWEVEGRRVCGVVANPEPHPREEPPRKGEMPRYSYPGGLPAPIDRSARIIVRFELRF